MKHIILSAGRMLAIISIAVCANTAKAQTAADSSKPAKITEVFAATEMGCTTDSKMVEKALYRTKGVKAVKINGEKITITYDPSKVKRDMLIHVIENTGTCEDPNAKVHKVSFPAP